jgi:hypothetical protein
LNAFVIHGETPLSALYFDHLAKQVRTRTLTSRHSQYLLGSLGAFLNKVGVKSSTA